MKAAVADNFTALRCPKDGIFWLSPQVNSPMVTLNFQHGMQVMPPVTSQSCFSRAKVAVNFGLNKPTSNGWKISFRLPTTTALFIPISFLTVCENKICRGSNFKLAQITKAGVIFTFLPFYLRLLNELLFYCLAGCYCDSHSGKE